MRKVTNDHRTRLTKMMIRKAFMDLLKQKPIQSISIRELCETAGINRGTFYTHYADIYDLMQRIEEEMLADFEKALERLFQLQEEPFNPVTISTGIFQCLRDNSDLCTVTLGDYGNKRFAAKLINIGRERCVDTYLKYFKGASPKQIEYFYAFVSAGCIGLLRKWLDDGMTCSAQEIAEMAENIMLYGLGIFSKESAALQ